jgi:hypothetical protein
MFFLVFALLMGGFAAQDALQHLTPRPLKASTVRKLEVPPFGSFGNTLCDESLAMYDHLASGSYKHTTILRTSLSGNESTLYKLPDEFADSTVFNDFSVTPDGAVTALVEDEQGHSMRFDFDSEGKVSSHANLELSDEVEGDKIAIFPNNTMLFSGHYRANAAAGLRGKRFIALFQPSGKLIRRLDQTGREDVTLDLPANHIPDGGITVGRDGNVYLLGSDKVLVISASGRIQNKIPFTKPDPEFSAVHVQYSQGLLVISFAKPGKTIDIFQYLVVNASTGEPVGLYEPTEDTGNSNVCFSRSEGFLFATIKNDRENIITAPLR